MRLLDLFCGAGGAAMGYSRAGFDEIVGVDIKPQPRYPFNIIEDDALEFVRKHGHEFDAIHASPPCQAHTALRTAWNAKRHISLVGATRVVLNGTGKPYVIENVPGAPLHDYVVLCGTMFGLGTEVAELRRHRLFEMRPAIPMFLRPHGHKQRSITIGVYGQHGRDRRRGFQTFFSVADGKKAMGIDWMNGDELSQAIPPAYTEYIGRALLEAIRA